MFYSKQSWWMFVFVPFILALSFRVAPVWGADAPAAPSQLRCEYLTNPLGVDTPQPRFSWVLAACATRREAIRLPDRGRHKARGAGA